MPAPTARRTRRSIWRWSARNTSCRCSTGRSIPAPRPITRWSSPPSQGVGKDRVLEAMFSPYYREGIPSPRVSPADFARGIAGAIVAHAAEMSAWRKSDVEEQKAALTRCVDHGRPAYGYETRSYPRRTCLAFTTNDIEFLQDATGDRRYWPVTVIRDRIDIEGLRRDRDQTPRGGAAAAEERRAALADAGGGGAPHRPRTAEVHAGGSAGDPRHPAAVHRRGAADDATEPRGLRLEMAAPSTTSEGALPRRLLRKCFGMYAAVKRQGLDRASKRDIAYCTTWLRENDWRRVRKHLPDGQRVMVWQAPDLELDPHSGSTPSIGAWVYLNRKGVAERPARIVDVR